MARQLPRGADHPVASNRLETVTIVLPHWCNFHSWPNANGGSIFWRPKHSVETHQQQLVPWVVDSIMGQLWLRLCSYRCIHLGYFHPNHNILVCTGHISILQQIVCIGTGLQSYPDLDWSNCRIYRHLAIPQHHNCTLQRKVKNILFEQIVTVLSAFMQSFIEIIDKGGAIVLGIWCWCIDPSHWVVTIISNIL